MVSGAAIAGLVGVTVVLFQQWYADRRRFETDTLAPAYSYVSSMPKDCPWENLPVPPWKELDPYSWQKIPTKYRESFQRLAVQRDAYEAAYGRWFEFGGERGWASFDESLRSLFLPYSPDNGNTIIGRRIGLESNVTVPLHSLAYGSVPYVLLNIGGPDRAWDQLTNNSPGSMYWAKEAVRALRKSDPALLQKVFDAIVANPDSTKARTLLESMRDSYGKFAVTANSVKMVLANRLGFKE